MVISRYSEAAVVGRCALAVGAIRVLIADRRLKIVGDAAPTLVHPWLKIHRVQASRAVQGISRRRKPVGSEKPERRR